MTSHRTTISTIQQNRYDEKEGALLRKWCDEAAKRGGSFQIECKYDSSLGMVAIYTINWPASTGEHQ